MSWGAFQRIHRKKLWCFFLQIKFEYNNYEIRHYTDGNLGTPIWVRFHAGCQQCVDDDYHYRFISDKSGSG